MKQLASRVQFEVPPALLDREIDRRVEEFVRRLIDQQIDPMQDEHQLGGVPRAPARGRGEAVRGALVLDEVARREHIDGLAKPTSTTRSRGTPSAPAGRRRPCAPGWKKRGESGVCTRGCGAKGPLISSLSRATIVQT